MKRFAHYIVVSTFKKLATNAAIKFDRQWPIYWGWGNVTLGWYMSWIHLGPSRSYFLRGKLKTLYMVVETSQLSTTSLYVHIYTLSALLRMELKFPITVSHKHQYKQ